ncbi:CLUMA_CG017940, isoform A [Clunio marinus]|uniref:CLUMA_CG017940, isoform A n=1 Tax=Clunio marinus TaxID=568069 RepID=A0A1J1J206_9DIPT|nr:CLUMA_CG017940, isoform A [Clunio marinus]
MQLHIWGILLLMNINLNIMNAKMDPYHAYRNLDTNSLHDSNTINQNFSSQPFFDFSVARNVTTRVGQTAFLSCRVEQLGDKLVSWIRKRDLHILSAGLSTYTSDERFQIVEYEPSENWTLQIKFAQLRDSGIYECQVSTEPKMSLAYRLNVVEAKAIILGQSDLYVKMGSKVILTCVISQGPHDLGTIVWYRGSMRINQTQLNDLALSYPLRVSIDVKWTEALTSRLKILNARLSDSGNYSCVPTMGESSSVMVHVINGEHPQAMQKSDSFKTQCMNEYITIVVALLATLVMRLTSHCKDTLEIVM